MNAHALSPAAELRPGHHWKQSAALGRSLALALFAHLRWRARVLRKRTPRGV